MIYPNIMEIDSQLNTSTESDTYQWFLNSKIDNL